MKKSTFPVIRTAIFALALAIAYYVVLPPINLQSVQFWLFALVFAVIGLLFFVGLPILLKFGTDEIKGTVAKRLKIMFLVPIAMVAVVVVGTLFSSPFFNASRYANMLQKKEGNFQQDLAELTFDQIPTVDRDSATRLGNRKMGEVVELVSQFNVAEDFSQINYNNRPVRVSPLEYADFIKWFTNNKGGIPHYVLVDMIQGEAKLVELAEPIRYSPSEYFARDLYRTLRFNYPLDIFNSVTFEIDETGRPFWIASIEKKTIGLFGGPDISGVVILDAATGEHKKYPIGEVPVWVERVYGAEMILEQMNYNGKFQDGFWNSVFSQKGVLMTTKGYNYLAKDEDIYLYTGITSVVADESNIGFILVNMRTKETLFYSIPSAEEYSAMESAQGAVQEKGYKSTFPLLLNINAHPTYFMSMKDEAGLVKMYAFVNAQSYQNVSVGNSVHEALERYKTTLVTLPTAEEKPDTILEKKGVLTDIKPIVIEGTTYYYFLLENDDNVYSASVTLSPGLPFMSPGVEIAFTYADGASALKTVYTIVQ